MSPSRNWLPILLVALAFLVRVWALELRPPHFDEGVNGSFVDEMRRIPAYRYQPDNFHGPLHFYALFTSSQLFGRGVWSLRLPTVLIGTATVALAFAFRRFFPPRVVLVAAIAMACSPGMIFYARDAIHETWLPFFAMLAAYGALGIAGGERQTRDLWAIGAGLAGMVLTKETYVLHFAAAFCAWLAGRWMSPTPPQDVRTRPAAVFGIDDASPISPRPAFARGEVALVAGVCMAVVVAFYSGFFGYWAGVEGIFTTFAAMARKGWTASEEGHHKEFLYYVKLLGAYEWPALIGLAIAPLLALRRSMLAGSITLGCGIVLAVASWLWAAGQPIAEHTVHTVSPALQTFGIPWTTAMSLSVCAAIVGLCWMFSIPPPCPRLRLLALYGLASVAAYSFVSYKTPWCVINLLWPFYFLLGHLFERMTAHGDGRAVAALGAIIAMAPVNDLHRINFTDPTDASEPYIYVQQSWDLYLLTSPIAKLIKANPEHRKMTGTILYDFPQPLPWALPELPNVILLSHLKPIDVADADFLLVHESRVEEVESHLLDIYYRSRFRFYSEGENHQLYLRAATFRDTVEPGREPEFHRRIPLETKEDESP